MFQRWCPAVLILVVVSSAISKTWADDLPPHFSTLTLSPEQNDGLAQLRKSHVSLPAERISPKTELAFFNDCWKVLTEEQKTAWNDAAGAELVVPKEWTELGLSDDQRNLLARPSALYSPRIDEINRELRELFNSVEESKKKASAAGVSEQMKIVEAMHGLIKRVTKATTSRNVWEKAMDSEMRECLTAEQRMRLLVIEAKPLLPKKYAALRLTDDQLARLAPKLKKIVPTMDALKSEISSLASRNVGDVAGFQDDVDKLEEQLSDALNAVLTDAQRAQLKKTDGS